MSVAKKRARAYDGDCVAMSRICCGLSRLRQGMAVSVLLVAVAQLMGARSAIAQPQPPVVQLPAGFYHYIIEYDIGPPYIFRRGVPPRGDEAYVTETGTGRVKYDPGHGQCGGGITCDTEGLKWEANLTAHAEHKITLDGPRPIARVTGSLSITQDPNDSAWPWPVTGETSLVASVEAFASSYFLAEARIIQPPPPGFSSTSQIPVIWNAAVSAELTGTNGFDGEIFAKATAAIIRAVGGTPVSPEISEIVLDTLPDNQLLGVTATASDPTPPRKTGQQVLNVPPSQLLAVRTFAIGEIAINNGDDVDSTFKAKADPVLRIDPDWEYAEYFELVISPNFVVADLIKDIRPGAGHSLARPLAALGSKFFFTAHDGSTGIEMHVSDGTEAGTQLLADILPGSAGSQVGNFAVFDDRFYFGKPTGPGRTSLYQSDGTTAGTAPVMVNGETLQSTGAMVVAGDTLYFGGNDFNTGKEIWKTDGTEAGTMVVKDIQPGFAHSNPARLTAVGNRLFFTARDPDRGNVLWASDGTSEGTQIATDVDFGNLGNFTDVSGTLYFTGDDGVHLTELWKSDGTPAGTVLVKDIRMGQSSQVQNLFALGDQLLFAADDGTHGLELWASDGTEVGTLMLVDINPGVGGSLNSEPMVEYDGLAYFVASDGSNTGTAKLDLWRSDGTPDGTELALDMDAGGMSELYVFDEFLAFITSDGDVAELWITDGSEEGTVQKFTSTGSQARIESLVALGNRLFFSADAGEGLYGQELYSIDLTPPSPRIPLIDIFPDLTPGDANLDGMVDELDRELVEGNLGFTDAASWTTGDFNGDLAVTQEDLDIILALLGQPGDTDGDGDVDLDDLNNVRNFFGTEGMPDGLLVGDAYPFDGFVSIDDLNLVRNHFGAVAAAVPEPGAGGLALLGVLTAVGCVVRDRRFARGAM